MQETLNQVFGVIVLYRMKLMESPTFKSLTNAVKNQEGILNLLIYDNSPEVQPCESFCTENIKIEICNNPQNPGVSKAYNSAYRIAREKDKKWLLLLDQDTQLPTNFFSEFFAARCKDDDKNIQLYLPIIYSKNKIISPGNYIAYRGFERKKIRTGISKIKRLAIINTGIIIDVSLFEQAGGFNEEVKLDFSDMSFFRRVKQCSKESRILNVKCNHSFSGHEEKNYADSLNRFRIFNTNAIAFSKERGVSKTLLLITVLIRALHLSLKFRSFNFLREFKLDQ